MIKIRLKAWKEAGKLKPNVPIPGCDFDFNATIADKPLNNPSSLRRSSRTEWRVRHVGLSPYPRYTWRKRETIELEIAGSMYVDQALELEKSLLFRTMRVVGVGICFQILNAAKLGVSPKEYWVFNTPLEIRTTDKGVWDSSSQVFIPWVSYRVIGTLVYVEE